MAEETKTVKELPGIRLEPFRAGVEALVALRDAGKFLVFLTGSDRVKLVGEREEFRAALSNQLKGVAVSDDECGDILGEIRNFLNLWATVKSIEGMVKALMGGPYEQAVNKLEEGERAGLREELESEIRLVDKELFTDALKRRVRRMRTATVACLEDLDVEVVRERRDEASSGTIDDPFLRLRIRYSKAMDRGWRFIPSGWTLGLAPGPVDSLELECDETDIDLLIRRLLAAKQRLLVPADKSRED